MTANLELRDAVEVIREARGRRDIVVPSMGSAREWMSLGPTSDLDLVLVPSAMGHATSVGLGLALAQPERRVIVLSGDGSLLMNLGTLVTISAQAPPNLVVIVFMNGVYEVTGAQVMPGAASGRANADPVDFGEIAKSCGIRSVFRFSTPDQWRKGIHDALSATGPTFVTLDVLPVAGAVGPGSPGPTRERAQRFMSALVPGHG